MDASAFAIKATELFNKLVDDFIPIEESAFKTYAKAKLNPIFNTVDFKNNIEVVKFIDKEMEQVSVVFEGALKDPDSQLKYHKWAWQLQGLILPKFIALLKDNTNLIEINEIKGNVDTYFPEVAFQIPPELKQIANIPLNYISTSLEKFAPTIHLSLYYWEKPNTELLKLYNLLLSGRFIEPNEFFIESFKDVNVNSKYKTIWNDEKQTSLFALLYLIYGKNSHFKNETIGIIANKLFKTKFNKASTNSINTAFNNFMTRNKKNYLEKNHAPILHLVSQLKFKHK